MSAVYQVVHTIHDRMHTYPRIKIEATIAHQILTFVYIELLKVSSTILIAFKDIYEYSAKNITTRHKNHCMHTAPRVYFS